MDNEQKLIELIDQPVDFFKRLNYLEEEKTRELVEELNSEKQVDLFDLALKALESNCNVFDITRVLERVAFLSTFNIEKIIQLFKLLFESMKNDMASGRQYYITQNIIENNKEYSKTLLERLYKEDNSFIVPHLSNIFIVLHNYHKENQYENLLKLVNSDNNNKVLVGVKALSIIDLTKAELREIFTIYQKLLNSADLELQVEILYASSTLLEKDPEFSKILLSISCTNDPKIKFQLSHILSISKKEYLEETWFKEILFKLADTKQGDKGITNNLTHILHSFLEKQEYQLIKEFLIKWVENSSLSYNFFEEFFSYFTKEFQHKHSTELDKFMTETLLSEEEKHHSLLALISPETKLDKSQIEKMDEEEILYICRKILGYKYDFEILVNLVFSILQDENLSNDSINIVQGILLNFIGKNYRGNLIEYFDNLKIKDLNKLEKKVRTSLQKELKTRQETDKKLPNLKELYTPSKHRRLMNQANNLSMKKLMEKSDENSLMSLLMPNKMILKYGKGSFYKQQDGKYSKPMSLQQFSTSVNIPFSEISNPVSAELERFYFRLVKKGEK